MDLNAGQTRRFLLGGGIHFPTQYPKSGTILLDVGQLTLHAGDPPVARDLLIVQESCGDATSLRVLLREDVLGFFVPGTRDGNGDFHISYEPQVDNFEQGEWFLDSDLINLNTVRGRLSLPPNADISSRDSVLRGIAFVPEDSRTIHVTEVSQLAGECGDDGGYPCCRYTCCR